MVRGFCVVAAVVLAACPRPPPAESCQPANGGFGGFGGTGGGSTLTGLADFQVQGDLLEVPLFIAMECPDDLEVSASVSVQDPNNDTVTLLEGEMSRVVTDRTSFGMTTVVKVRASLAGPYHFTARFEPNLGRVQRDLIVAEEHRDAGPELVVPAGSMLNNCQHIDLSEDGRPLCLAQNVRVFDRAGMVQQTLSTSGVAARAGRVLWLRDSTVLQRWLETDAGFVRDGDAGLVVPNGAILAAEEESVLVAGTFEVQLVERTDAGTLVGRVDPNIVANSPVGVWKRGDEYAIIGNQGGTSTVCSGRFRDAGTCTFGNSGGLQQQPNAVASEPSGLWTSADDFAQITTLQLRGPALREFVLPSGWSAQAGPVGWDTGAILANGSDGRKLVAGDRNGAYVLQAFPAQTMMSVTSRWVTLLRQNADIAIYRR